MKEEVGTTETWPVTVDISILSRPFSNNTMNRGIPPPSNFGNQETTSLPNNFQESPIDDGDDNEVGNTVNEFIVALNIELYHKMNAYPHDVNPPLRSYGGMGGGS